ncbi:Hypothetical predicted protein [Olea europaea subsp. europaea]|uniref:DUF1985 domain-containing protein n=1 Tax=Olea europaea subsp. europaea TaxID=158383 RepID=A0A8S0PY59_OLEEU|nr:Hypothetical predicted protein [Olea europaea subsp. europaea]
MMEFEFHIPEDARLRAHILQRSNLKLVKTVMDHFNERRWEDFRNSSLGYLAEVPDIQFSAQLIQQLVFRTVRTNKLYELWFSVQGHLTRFGLQEYAFVTRLRCSSFLEGVEYERLLQRRRLKERHLLHGFRGTWAKKFQKAKRRKEKEITYTVHGFPIAMQVLAYEALPKVREHDIARIVVVPLFNASGDDSRDDEHGGREDSDEEASEGGSSEEQMSRGDEEKGASSSDPDGEDSEDTGEFKGDRSSAREDTRGRDRGPLPQLDHREVLLHSDGARHRQQLLEHLHQALLEGTRRSCSTLVARAGPTTTVVATGIETEASISGFLPEDVYGGPVKPCPNEKDIPMDTGNMQGATEPSNAVGDDDDDDDAEGCDGVVTKFVASRSILEHESEFLQRDSARHDCEDRSLLPELRIRGEGEENEELNVMNWSESTTMVLYSFLDGD